ncbi:MAG: GMC oxidoreductase [Micrococcales bacterium]|nr:GMC oxidoreductase [Micrococcales bacterium]
MTLSRRTFLTSSATVVATAAAGVGTASAATGAPGAAVPARSALLPKSDSFYRNRVPQLFDASYQEPVALGSHSEVLVIGTGFGAAITALRLGQAGAQVAMLERGLRWPLRPRYATAVEKLFNQGDTFSPETIFSDIDGRALWFRRKVDKGLHGLPILAEDFFAGALEVIDQPGIQVWQGSAVGGGSIIYTGVLIAPEQRFFDHAFAGIGLTYQEMSSTWWPKALATVRGSTMPDDIYRGQYGKRTGLLGLGPKPDPFGHCRTWDNLFTKAGHAPHKIDSNFAWNVVRDELDGLSRPSSTNGETNFGNSNGAKFDLTQGALKDAVATGKVTIHPQHVVTAIGQEANGRYWVRFDVINPFGSIVRKDVTVTCDRLVLGAGSIGSTELLLRARHAGTLQNVNEHVGQGWGTNGDAAVIVRHSPSTGLTQGNPSPSRILDEGRNRLPVTFENWAVPGVGANPSLIGLGLIASLGMTLDDTRSGFSYNPGADRSASRTQMRMDGKPDGGVTLDWPSTGNDETVRSMREVINHVADVNKIKTGVPGLVPDVNAGFTAHPLGGAVLGKATDGYGRVTGHPGLYVVDGALIPGSTGTVNPVLTIAALAERNVAQVIQDGK